MEITLLVIAHPQLEIYCSFALLKRQLACTMGERRWAGEITVHAFFNVMFVLSVVFTLRFGALKHAGLIGCYLLFELFSKIKSGLEK